MPLYLFYLFYFTCSTCPVYLSVLPIRSTCPVYLSVLPVRSVYLFYLSVLPVRSVYLFYLPVLPVRFACCGWSCLVYLVCLFKDQNEDFVKNHRFEKFLLRLPSKILRLSTPCIVLILNLMVFMPLRA